MINGIIAKQVIRHLDQKQLENTFNNDLLEHPTTAAKRRLHLTWRAFASGRERGGQNCLLGRVSFSGLSADIEAMAGKPLTGSI